MKKGLLIYKPLKSKKNIGDYVQSVAAQQYTGRDVVFVEREHLHEYAGDPIKLIMNGWFMLIPENWPPSKDIVPFLTSFHISPDVSEVMLNETGVDYLKKYVEKYGPVGARDRGTEQLLKSKGIAAYFSGCLTLTLGKTYRHNPKSERICFVDVHHDVTISKKPLALLSYFSTLLSKRETISKIAKKLYGTASLRNLLRASQFHRTFSQFFEDKLLEDAEYVKHALLESRLGSEESKLDLARDFLQKYAESRLVVTSRIHAALPSLGMDTPVIFVTSDDIKPTGRFDGLLDFFNAMEYSNLKLKPILGFKPDKKIGLNHTVRNKQNHVKIAEELYKNCTSFINNGEQGQKEKPEA